MEKAAYFHQRMMRGQYEPKESAIRIMFLEKLQKRDEQLELLALRYGTSIDAGGSTNSAKND